MTNTIQFFFALLCSLNMVSSDSRPPPEFKVELMGPGVYGASNMESGDHSMIILTSEGIMVVETFSTRHAEVLLNIVKDLSSMKIKRLLVSHNHWDHASGTRVFRLNDPETEIMCHEEALPAIKANLGPDQEVPNTVWKGDKEIYYWGNTTIEYNYLGINHALGNTIVVVKEADTAFIADIVSPGRLIFSVSPDFNIKELERTLEEIKTKLTFTKVVYAHNTQPENWKGGTKQDVLDFAQYLKDLRAEVNKYLFDPNVNFMDVADKVKLPKYETWTFYNQFLAMNAWRIITDEVMGPYPWRPAYHPSVQQQRYEPEGNNAINATCSLNLIAFLLFIALVKNIFNQS